MSTKNPFRNAKTFDIGRTFELGTYIFIWPKINQIRLFPKIWINKVEVEEDAIVFGHRYNFTIELIISFTVYLEIRP